MKTNEPHKLLAPAHFERLLGRNRNLATLTLKQIETGEGVPQLCYEGLMRLQLEAGCICVILGQGDEEAKKQFGASVGYALKMLSAVGVRGGGIARSYEAHVELSDERSRVTALHQKHPMPGSERLSIGDYNLALIAVVSFGERSALAEVAAIREEQYRNPGTIASEDYWRYLRACKALLRGDDAEATKEAEEALPRAKSVPQSQIAALVALLHNDSPSLTESLEARLQAHRKQFQKEPNSPFGAVCLAALMLCRIALDRRMRVEDGPYLPVRLLPNYPGL